MKLIAASLIAVPALIQAQVRAIDIEQRADSGIAAPALASLVNRSASDLRDAVERFASDRAALHRRYDVAWSPTRRERLRQFYTGWQGRLRELDFDGLAHGGKIDYVLLTHRLTYELSLLDREAKEFSEMATLLPFAPTIIGFQESRRRFEPVDQPAVARALAAMAADVDRLRRQVEAAAERERTAAARPVQAGSTRGASPAAAADPNQLTLPSKIVVYRAANTIDGLRTSLQSWYRFSSGYDPMFSWWAANPYAKADTALRAYTRTLRERVLGFRPNEDDPIIADPIGRDGLAADLANEMMPYTPEEMVRIAEREYAWCETELKKAAREMGFGDDWKAALEKVKNTYVEPGRQPALIRDLAIEATRFVESRDLVTVPPLAKEIWRMEMMSPERQKIAPFFLGGEVVQVSYPTDGMEHDDKMMSLRGNNPHFSRAVVHHELIPGHHLQGFMNQRHATHRSAFRTPFWTEGWALYWEMLLWDLGFAETPEDRIGMLFWRTHRAARIIFSLRVHLGTMTPQEAIDFLVDRVGHERANAEAEVRRSFVGTYPPLYQAAYMLGGLQFRALHRELVGSGRITDREFHDAILQSGTMPVEMVRAALTGQALSRDYRASWRFAN